MSSTSSTFGPRWSARRWRAAALTSLIAVAACSGNSIAPETPEVLLGRYTLVSYRGERLPVAWNPQAPTWLTTAGWFEFSEGARCEYGFTVLNSTNGETAAGRVPCRYRVSGATLAIQIGDETDFDLNGSWTARQITLRDPVGDELVYGRP